MHQAIEYGRLSRGRDGVLSIPDLFFTGKVQQRQWQTLYGPLPDFVPYRGNATRPAVISGGDATRSAVAEALLPSGIEFVVHELFPTDFN